MTELDALVSELSEACRVAVALLKRANIAPALQEHLDAVVAKADKRKETEAS